MKDDYYTYPDINNDDIDISSDERTPEDNGTDLPSSSLHPSSKGGDTPFRVTLGRDDSMKYRRPTSRPASYQRQEIPKNVTPDRRPHGRKLSDFDASTQNHAASNPNQSGSSYANFRETANQDSFSRKPVVSSQTNVRQQKNNMSHKSPTATFRQTDRSSMNSGRQVNSRSHGKGKKVVVSIVALFLVLLLAFGGYGFVLLGSINHDTSTRGKNEFISDSELMSSSDVQNILIIGSDARGDVDGMRSDTMILASIDKKNHQLKLTSFLRDSLVKIPARNSYNKLNAAFSFGGAKMVIDTIEYNFKVKIDNYVIVDFEIFTEFINAIGGVDVDGITEAEVNWLRANVRGININPGKSHLTGGAALWYCRVRKIDSDFKRTERQRKVVGAVINQIKHTNPLKTFNAVKKILPMITTDIGSTSLMSLGINGLLRYMRYDMFQMQIPAEGTWWNKTYSIGAVLEMDISKNAEKLKDFIYSKQVKE